MDTAAIDKKVRASLNGTPYTWSSLEPIASGFVNWNYHAKLLRPLDDGTTEVLIKHGEKHMKTKPEFPLNLLRCYIESECYRLLANSPFTGNAKGFVVRTPKFFHFDEDNTNQVLEHLSNAITLRDYFMDEALMSHANVSEARFHQLGKAAGDWLSKFMEWGASSSEFRALAAENGEVQQIRHMVSFKFVYDRIKEYPAILGDVKAILEEVEKSVEADLKDESKVQPIHGDFALGNLILPNTPFDDNTETPILVIDWEMAELGVPNTDLGHIIADVYALWRFKSNEPALWMMQGLLEAYGDVTEDFAFRTALQVGSHLICVVPVSGWLVVEPVEEAISHGRDVVLHAWKRDRGWFERDGLRWLFAKAR